MTQSPYIVVGADGTFESAAAVRWAYQHAGELGVGVLVLCAWEVPLDEWVSPTKTEADYGAVWQQRLNRTIELAGPAPEGIGVRVQLIQHHPATALVDAAKEAVLLVVGSHSYGEIQAPHLGSVASYCAHHAVCPVLIFRMSKEDHDRVTTRST